jgi:rSAM/selenodomain-associated transferase 2
VIIPTLNEGNCIAETITSVRQSYTMDQVEIIIADGGSTDTTLECIPVDTIIIHAPRGRARQMNAGAAVAQGKYLAFVHADTRLPEGWREEIINLLSDPWVSGGTFQCTLEPAKGLMKVFNLFTMPPWWMIMYGDQVQFMARDTFVRLGKFKEIPLMEDVEMSRTLHLNGRLVRSKLRITTSSRRFLETGVLRQYWINFTCMIRYLYLGATPEDIQNIYRSSRERHLD